MIQPPQAKKCLLVLLDGLADRAHAQLGWQTPLQRAATPNLDRLAALGACGHFHATFPGQALPSEEAHFAMMGYPQELFPGRGYLEGLGEAMAFSDQDVLLLAHLGFFQPQDGRLLMIEKKPKLPEEQARAFFQTVGDFACPLGRAEFKRARGSSGVLVLSGEVAPFITDSDPMLPGRPLLLPRPWAERADHAPSMNAAALLAAYLRHAHRVLAGHPLNLERQAQGLAAVNGVLTQRAGQRTNLPPLHEAWGLRVLSLSSAPIYRGLFQFMGAEAELLPEGATPGGDVAAKLEIALARLEQCDLIHLHSKAPDEAAHEKDPWLKVRVIESLDQGLAPLPRLLEAHPELLVVVTGDHATPSAGELIHSGEPSPLLIAGCGVWRDGAVAFDEVSCAAGALHLLRGREFMSTILAFLDRAKLKGLRDHPGDLPFYPGPDLPLDMALDME
jgi:2,3-bisphosphoglycerate-independent phosphoglycerate mutase